MTRSDDRSGSQERRRWRILVRHEGVGGSVSLGVEAITTDTVDGNAKTQPGWAGRKGRRAGKRSQGMAKRLTLTKRRLSFTFAEGTPRLEGQVLRQPRGGPMEAALILRLLLIKEKEQKKQAAGIDPILPAHAHAGMTCLLEPR